MARGRGGFIGHDGLNAPDAPTIGTATDVAGATGGEVTLTFTAPTDVGGGAITEYIVAAIKTSDGSVVGSTVSASPATISGLTNNTAYTLTVTAKNTFGISVASAASNSVTPTQATDSVYTTPGTYSFVIPSGLNPATISAVAVGGGGSGYGAVSGGSVCTGAGGGASLAYVNSSSVTAGQSWSVVVGSGGVSTGQNGQSGGSSRLLNPSSSTVLQAGGGTVGGTSSGGAGGTVAVGTGGSGGAGGNGRSSSNNWWPPGGGGAGGYSGNGGVGANSANNGASGSAGSGGASGGGATGYGLFGGSGGGGTGLYGEGTSGGTVNSPGGGRRGSCVKQTVKQVLKVLMVVRQVILTMREAQQVVCLVAAVEVQTLQRTMAERMKGVMVEMAQCVSFIPLLAQLEHFQQQM